ncbi:MAG TPA: STAS domain-containing protein [Spirochaetota bacterium]|nr:STAS domain-containing protein [Spirochaetota bacterium]HPF06406.1 STAS domain-containing protein [Spirochaetota bacterium]HPR36819.1 STAS domain-containing protein [Spirochaetota bacterium]HRX46358.1 STAS domain-containing protein [Spirochaetota bacterium]
MDRFRYISEVEINQKGKVVIITLPKYFYIGNIIEVEQSWENILKKEPSVIGFDCEKLEFIDSSAIGTLVKFFNSSVKNNIEMYVFGLKTELIKIFDTTKINRVMSVINKSEFEERFLN